MQSAPASGRVEIKLLPSICEVIYLNSKWQVVVANWTDRTEKDGTTQKGLTTQRVTFINIDNNDATPRTSNSLVSDTTIDINTETDSSLVSGTVIYATPRTSVPSNWMPSIRKWPISKHSSRKVIIIRTEMFGDN